MKNEKHICPTCGAVTTEYTFTFSRLDAILLIMMAKEVRATMNAHSVSFTEANKIHIPSLPVSSNVSKRMTISSKLGLIAKYKVNGHQQAGMWVITARGWAALRGESVPARVSEFRGQITERFDETTTIADALKTYPGSEYNSQEWFEFGKQMI